MHPDLLIFLGISIVPVLILARYRRVMRLDRGVYFILVGTGLLSLAALVDYLEETLLEPFMLMMADKGEWNLLVAVLGYIPGVFLTGLGLSRWFHVTLKLESEIKKRERAEESLKRRSEQLKEALVAASEANQAKSEFLAKMSHELRTPLNAIIGFSEVMNNKVYGSLEVPEYAEYAEHIHESGKLLLGIINDILDLAKVEAGQITITEEAFFLRSLVTDCLPIVQARASEQGIYFVSKTEDDLVLWADKRIVKQMLLNLLSNAIKFSQKGGEILVKSYARTDGSHVLEVFDHGVGMTNEEIDLALEPFSQAQASKVYGDNAGAGLGLALVNTFMGLHDGTVELTSKKGRGTHARLIFPASRAVKPSDDDSLNHSIMEDFRAS
ncbi:hypothetical protein KFE96_07135 [Kordiimonas sp. SCSIO 12603]|uniref:sensor histidine kinase n=1 Tax=Kordiimonas sp. SCSIO 12603 TaxID=2829596 RepID=UPI0021070A83|nr:ATP-binding protein [Kordiimonas sp. SCSIO 12603]UTW60077.1 hypothetical protein KFE96_07135 [Kordiimonas sp. SCSIO 12603]